MAPRMRLLGHGERAVKKLIVCCAALAALLLAVPSAHATPPKLSEGEKLILAELAKLQLTVQGQGDRLTVLEGMHGIGLKPLPCNASMPSPKPAPKPTPVCRTPAPKPAPRVEANVTVRTTIEVKSSKTTIKVLMRSDSRPMTHLNLEVRAYGPGCGAGIFSMEVNGAFYLLEVSVRD